MTPDFHVAVQTLLRVGDYDAALALLRQAGLGREAGLLLERLGRPAEAALELAAAGDHAGAGRCHRAAGAPDAAAAAFRQAGDLATAEQVLREAGRLLPLAELLLDAGRDADALAVLASIGRLGTDDPRYVGALVLRGRLAERASDWGTAARAYDAALRFRGLLPETAGLALRTAQVCAAAGDRVGAQRRLDELVARGLVTRAMAPTFERLQNALGIRTEATTCARPPDVGSFRQPSAPGAAPASPASSRDSNAPPLTMVRPAAAPAPPAPTSFARPTGRSLEEVLPAHPRYEFLKKLGAGGMGVVYLARDLEQDRTIVIKLLQNTVLPTETAKDLFLREAVMVSYLKHPNIVAVYDFGNMGPHPYIAMEYVDGHDLGRLSKEAPERRLPLDETVRIFGQACAALDHAHREHVIHRDIKLNNMMLTSGGVLKLLDFGLARAVFTALGTRDEGMGTPFYMAPELIRRDYHDHRVDIYAIGVALYRVLTGHYPFRGDDVLRRHVHERPRDPGLLAPDLPMEVGAVILRCLEKDPDERFESAGAVAAALEKAAR